MGRMSELHAAAPDALRLAVEHLRGVPTLKGAPEWLELTEAIDTLSDLAIVLDR